MTDFRTAGRPALASSVLALALAACSVGPDFVRPELPAVDAFTHAGTESASTAPAGIAMPDAAHGPFWEGFGDARLTALVEDALTANLDLHVALARYDRANALLRGARFDQLPGITASAEASESRASADQAAGLARGERDGESYSAGIAATWEIDLFGRIRRDIEAGRAEALAGYADLQAAQVAIAGEVAHTYIELRGAQERLRVARDNAGIQSETMRLVQARFDAGRDSEFDTTRARAQLEATTARIPALEAQVTFAMHRLAVLTGRTPGALVEALDATAPLPALPGTIDPGTPGALLRRRPDVAAAEARLHAATARIGVATADLFPRFTLGGLIGSQAVDAAALFERDSETRLVALGIDWSFLDVGRVRARIAAADADAAGELARYRQAVLLALEDTENALVRLDRARAADAHLERAARDSARAAEFARTRFESGATGLLDVLDAERSRLQAEDAFAEGRTRSATGAVALYRALAGGWPQALRPLRESLGQR